MRDDGCRIDSIARSRGVISGKEVGPRVRRNRIKYAAATLAVILVGLASRAYSPPLPWFVRAYVGDALWALAAYLTVALLLPRLPVRSVALAAWLFSLAVEVSQLYRAPWIDEIRRLRVGALILGHGFLWSDLICYGVGIGIGALAEALRARRHSSNRRHPTPLRSGSALPLP